MRRTLVAFLSLTALLAGCASASHDERAALLSAPVNCAAAESDIAALEAAMPSRGERMRSAVQSATPIGAVKGVVTGTYDDQFAVLSGATEDELSARIDQIRAECGITENAGPASSEEGTK